MSGKTKLFSHPVLVTDMNSVVDEIVEWISTSERGATWNKKKASTKQQKTKKNNAQYMQA